MTAYDITKVEHWLRCNTCDSEGQEPLEYYEGDFKWQVVDDDQHLCPCCVGKQYHADREFERLGRWVKSRAARLNVSIKR